MAEHNPSLYAVGRLVGLTLRLQHGKVIPALIREESVDALAFRPLHLVGLCCRSLSRLPYQRPITAIVDEIDVADLPARPTPIQQNSFFAGLRKERFRKSAGD